MENGLVLKPLSPEPGGGYYNAVTPQYGARWQLLSEVAVIF